MKLGLKFRTLSVMKKLISKIVLVSILVISGGITHAASVTRHDQTASGLQGWRVTDGTVEIQLNPLLRDQVRAFYLARGFSDEITAVIERSCVFQTVITNVSDPASVQAVEVDLSQWRIETGAGLVPLTDKQLWLQRWAEMGAGEAAKVAFRWATFPWQQQYVQSGDYGWGMILLGEALPEEFKLLLRWDNAGIPQSQEIQGLSCPQ